MLIAGIGSAFLAQFAPTSDKNTQTQKEKAQAEAKVEGQTSTAGNTAGEGGTKNVSHAVGSAKQAQSVLNGIDPKYFNDDSRFGGGFYVGEDGDTIVAELAEHGSRAEYAISYDMDLSGQKVLDLTDSETVATWNYTAKVTSTSACQEIADVARMQGYNLIKFESYRGEGINYAIYSNFEDILVPRIVTPVD